MSDDVLVYDWVRCRPACVVLAAALGGNPAFAHEWPVERWITGGDIDGLRRFGPVTREQVQRLAQRDAGATA